MLVSTLGRHVRVGVAGSAAALPQCGAAVYLTRDKCHLKAAADVARTPVREHCPHIKPFRPVGVAHRVGRAVASNLFVQIDRRLRTGPSHHRHPGTKSHVSVLLPRLHVNRAPRISSAGPSPRSKWRTKMGNRSVSRPRHRHSHKKMF